MNLTKDEIPSYTKKQKAHASCYMALNHRISWGTKFSNNKNNTRERAQAAVWHRKVVDSISSPAIDVDIHYATIRENERIAPGSVCHGHELSW